MNCDGNYENTDKKRKRKEKVLRLPRKENDKQRWLTIIPRDNIPLSSHTVVCERHWPPEYPTILDYEKERPRDPPSVFTCVKPSLVSTTPTPLRPTTKCLAENRNVLPDDLASFNERDIINSFEDIENKFSTHTVDLNDIKVTNNLIFQSVDFLCNTGVPRFILRIYKNLTFEAFHSGVRCTVNILCQNRVYVLNRWSNMQEAVRFLYCLEMTPNKKVIHQ